LFVVVTNELGFGMAYSKFINFDTLKLAYEILLFRNKINLKQN